MLSSLVRLTIAKIIRSNFSLNHRLLSKGFFTHQLIKSNSHPDGSQNQTGLFPMNPPIRYRPGRSLGPRVESTTQKPFRRKPTGTANRLKTQLSARPRESIIHRHDYNNNFLSDDVECIRIIYGLSDASSSTTVVVYV